MQGTELAVKPNREHFGRTGPQTRKEKRVGETTNILDVVTSLGLAGKVIQV